MLKIAKVQFFSAFGRVDKGKAYQADAPVVKAFPGNFVTPDEWAELEEHKTVTFGPGVEQATAAPGEKRTTPPRKAAKTAARRK